MSDQEGDAAEDAHAADDGAEEEDEDEDESASGSGDDAEGGSSDGDEEASDEEDEEDEEDEDEDAADGAPRTAKARPAGGCAWRVTQEADARRAARSRLARA